MVITYLSRFAVQQGQTTSNVALRREWISPVERPLTFALSGAGGLSYALGDTALTYALAQADVLVTDELSGKITVGAGPAAGIVWRVTDNWNAQLGAKALYFPGDLDHTLVEYSLEQDLALNHDWGLRLSIRQQGISGAAVTEAQLSLSRYF